MPQDALTKIYHNVLVEALSEEKTSAELEFEQITNLVIEINPRFQNSVSASRSRVQKLKSKYEKNIKEIYKYFEDKNKSAKMEE